LAVGTLNIVTVSSTTAAERLKVSRLALGVSQSKLARLSGVARFKICTFELGSRSLSSEEQRRIELALEPAPARDPFAITRAPFQTTKHANARLRRG
jgi:predicted transcriptional regulator